MTDPLTSPVSVENERIRRWAIRNNLPAAIGATSEIPGQTIRAYRDGDAHTPNQETAS